MLFLRQQTLPLAKSLSGAVYGTVTMTSEEHMFISNLLKDNVKILNKACTGKQWLCGGDKPTFADYLLIISMAEL